MSQVVSQTMDNNQARGSRDPPPMPNLDSNVGINPAQPNLRGLSELSETYTYIHF